MSSFHFASSPTPTDYLHEVNRLFFKETSEISWNNFRKIMFSKQEANKRELIKIICTRSKHQPCFTKEKFFNLYNLIQGNNNKHYLLYPEWITFFLKPVNTLHIRDHFFKTYAKKSTKEDKASLLQSLTKSADQMFCGTQWH